MEQKEEPLIILKEETFTNRIGLAGFICVMITLLALILPSMAEVNNNLVIIVVTLDVILSFIIWFKEVDSLSSGIIALLTVIISIESEIKVRFTLILMNGSLMLLFLAVIIKCHLNSFDTLFSVLQGRFNTREPKLPMMK